MIFGPDGKPAREERDEAPLMSTLRAAQGRLARAMFSSSARILDERGEILWEEGKLVGGGLAAWLP